MLRIWQVLWRIGDVVAGGKGEKLKERVEGDEVWVGEESEIGI
jgi:hypothetical protein